MSGSAADTVPGEGRRKSRSARWITLGALLLLFAIAAVVVPLININRYHRTIAETLSRSLGRPVHLGSVQLQLLPSPGLALTDFVVEEDPKFGAEPLLRAPSVTVTLRASSLWRGRLEVGRIDLDNASVNLVRDARGGWNFGSLLVQAARIPNAPTTQRRSSSEARFPYIELRDARINFKQGMEKKAFSFLNSDLSIWLAEPDQWQVRFEAQPARTDLDLDLADTGLMTLEGSLNRASALDEIPVKLHAEWNKAPLGQVSRMVFGEDSGWRGVLRAEADVTGDIRDLQMNARFRVDDAHRQEFTPLASLPVDVQCKGDYKRPTDSVDGLTCLWPVGDGHLLLTGEVRSAVTRPEPHVLLEINRTPVTFAVSALGMLRHGLPPSLGATGSINGHFSYAGDGGRTAPALAGVAAVDSLSLGFPGVDRPIVFPTLHFVTPAPAAAPKHGGRGVSHHDLRHLPKAHAPVAILLEPAPVGLGAPNPLVLSGEFTAAGFALHVAGRAELARLAALSQSSGPLGSSLAGLAAATAGPPAIADLDLALTGPWMTPPNDGSAAASAQGWLRIEHAQARLDWLPEPLEIASATANFSPGKVIWTNASVTVNGIAAHGSYSSCDGMEDCPAGALGRFSLDIPTLDAAALESALIGAGRRNELLNAILAQVGRKTAPWPALEGTVHVGALSLGNLLLNDARGGLSIRGNRLTITSLDAGALGGSVNIAGSIDAAGNRPAYALTLNWVGVSVPQIAAVFHEKWGTGSVSGNATLTLEGYSASDLAASAQGAFRWDWLKGSFGSGAPLALQATLTAKASPDETTNAGVEKASFDAIQGAKFSPAHFSRWIASGTIADQSLKLNSAGRTNPVAGTISFDREIDLSWPAGNDTTLRIRGTLARPAVELGQPVSTEQ
jgi:hypothetical protein